MVRLICGLLSVAVLVGCSKGGGTMGGPAGQPPGGPQFITLSAGQSLAIDSVAHGGSDIQAVKTIDTAAVVFFPSLTASSTSSTSTGSTAVACTASFTDGTTKTGVQAVQVVLSCPKPQ